LGRDKNNSTTCREVSSQGKAKNFEQTFREPGCEQEWGRRSGAKQIGAYKEHPGKKKTCRAQTTKKREDGEVNKYGRRRIGSTATGKHITTGQEETRDAIKKAQGHWQIENVRTHNYKKQKPALRIRNLLDGRREGGRSEVKKGKEEREKALRAVTRQEAGEEQERKKLKRP